MITILRALEIAAECVEDVRRERYAAGEAAYQQGIRADKLQGDVTGAPFQWVEQDHEKYVELSQVLRQLADLPEIMSDPGVTIEQPELFAPSA